MQNELRQMQIGGKRNLEIRRIGAYEARLEADCLYGTGFVCHRDISSERTTQ